MVGKKDDHDKKEEKEKMEQEGGEQRQLLSLYLIKKYSVSDALVRIGLSRDGCACRNFTLSLLVSFLCGTRVGGADSPRAYRDTMPTIYQKSDRGSNAGRTYAFHPPPRYSYLASKTYSHRSFWMYPAAIVSIALTQ